MYRLMYRRGALPCPNRPNRVHASAHHGASPPYRSPQEPPAGLSRAAAKRVCGKLADHEVRGELLDCA
jgi:hypothetical protein